MAEVTQHDINYIVGKIVTVQNEPYPTILDTAYYVGRKDNYLTTYGYTVEREMLQQIIYRRILPEDMKTPGAVWDVAEALLDYVEENPREVENG